MHDPRESQTQRAKATEQLPERLSRPAEELSNGFIDGGLESDHLLLVVLFEKWDQLGGKA